MQSFFLLCFMEWFMHTHKLPHRDTHFWLQKVFWFVFSFNYSFCLVEHLIANISCKVFFFFTWFTKLILFSDLKLLLFCMYDPFVSSKPHYKIIMVHFLFPQKWIHLNADIIFFLWFVFQNRTRIKRINTR